MSIYGSTDMIRVSKIVPTLYVYYKIGNGPVNHSSEFIGYYLEESHKKTLLVAEALAHTALDVMMSVDLQQAVELERQTE